MSRQRKRVFNNVTIVEYKSMETYFEEMALKGWLIEKIGLMMTFRKIEPQSLTFNVAMVTPKTMLDWPDKEKTATIDEFCDSVGWHLASENQIYRIYYHKREIDVPLIYTESEDIYRTVKKAFFKSEFIVMLLPFLYLAIASLNVKNIRYDFFTSNASVLNLLFPFLISVFIWNTTLPSLYWIFVNGKNLRNKDSLFYYSPKWIRNKNRLQFVFIAVYLYILIASLLNYRNENISISLILVCTFPILLIFGFVLLFKKFVQKTKIPLLIKTGILLIGCGAIMSLWMMALLTLLGSGQLSNLEKKEAVVDTNILMLEELGFSGSTNIEWRHVNSSLFVPLSYEYNERLDNSEDQEYVNLRVEGMHMANVWLKDWVVEKVLNEERERYEEEVQYTPELENYIQEISGYEDFGVDIYNISIYTFKVMVIKDKEIYLVTYSKSIDNSILENILLGLFN